MPATDESFDLASTTVIFEFFNPRGLLDTPKRMEKYLSGQVIPRRRAAQKAAVNLCEWSSSDDEAAQSSNSTGKRRANTSSKPYTKRTKANDAAYMIESVSIRPRASSSSAIPRSKPVSKPDPANPGTRPSPQPIPRKPRPKQLEPEAPPKPASDDGESDLTSLSSSSTPASPDHPANKSLPASPPLMQLAARASLSQSLPAAVISTMPRFESVKSNQKDEKWSLSRLGTHVWVLIEDKNCRVFEPQDDEEDRSGRLWWPGKIKNSLSNPLQVQLFAAKVKDVEIHSPCAKNILSKLGPHGQTRFDSPTFVTNDNILASPRKKQRQDDGDLLQRWNRAVHEMMIDEFDDQQEDSDNLPEVGELISLAAAMPSEPSSSKKNTSSYAMGKRKRKRQPEITDEEGAEEEYESDWIPPGPDEELKIPGEIVLAHATRSPSFYWPAHVLDYVPPIDRRQKEGRYCVQYLDNTEEFIPRSWFFVAEDDGFATCKLGEFESAYVDHVEDEEDANEDNERARSPSPIARIPPPPAAEFSDLSIRQQFAYVKPVLEAILKDTYAPTRKIHVNFILGGSARKGVVDNASLRGKMDPKSVGELQKYLSEWCLRDERRSRMVYPDDGEGEGGRGPEDADAHGDDIIGDEAVNGGGAVVEKEPVQDSATIKERLGEEVKIQVEENEDAILHAAREVSPALTEPAMLSSPPDLPPDSSFTPLDDIPMERGVSPIESEPTSSAPGPEASFMTPSDAISVATEPAPSEEMVDSLFDPSNIDHESNQNDTALRTRQIGCEAYESLTGVEKVDYSVNVLLPEAIRQILLWRSGDRTSVDLLSPAQEHDLYKRGAALLNETDFVFDVMRLRRSAERRLAQRRERRGNRAPDEQLLSVSGRPRRKGTGMPNYQE
ncbi:hypothetical protein BDQ12DRAFT_736939 [Crucibulum laeve]|uniref:PWWP domain-containing protein n=1 Tax=Crucibulum laeve TaxID=68775 RepID=A0A5C3LVA6_9AGAR|nr:hypothetical protein BDQ12DRAFT_736939 [Crucibulum laeve]